MNLAIMTMMFVVSQLRPRLPASRRTVPIRADLLLLPASFKWDPTILAIIANNMELSTLEDAVTTARPDQDLIDLSPLSLLRTLLLATSTLRYSIFDSRMEPLPVDLLNTTSRATLPLHLPERLSTEHAKRRNCLSALCTFRNWKYLHFL
jgi:hypothetical protein